MYHGELRLTVLSTTTAATYTLGIIPYYYGCPATYTLLVNPPEDLTEYWVFPNFISPNGDFKNDQWAPSFKGVNGVELLLDGVAAGYSSIANSNLQSKASKYDDGMAAIEYVLIFYGTKELYRYTKESFPAIMWNPEEVKEKIDVFYFVKFINGKSKQGFINIDPTSKN
jgi:hypothetical protein